MRLLYLGRIAATADSAPLFRQRLCPFPEQAAPWDVYNFHYWQYVDDIYYYMHNLACVPPVVWTNAAHSNGVRMFAAVTADFNPCPGPLKPCEEFDMLFEDPALAASQLFAIVNSYCFDGWMFDVENWATPGPNLLKAMTLLRGMRLWNGELVEVGYYEAGSTSLDDRTFEFFNAGSSFQSDYTSSPSDEPEQTYKCLVKNKDVDARFNTYGSVYTNDYSSRTPGGLGNGCVYLDTAGFFGSLGLVKMTAPDTGDYQSIGIYAPDWTMYGGIYEYGCPLPARDVFRKTERQLWVGDNPTILPDGTLKTAAPAVSNFIAPRSTLLTTPFVTRFNTGQGDRFWMVGKPVANRAWNYLSGQDLLPTWIIPSDGSNQGVTADYTYDDAFDGGSSLAFTGMLAVGKTVEYSLFLANMTLGGESAGAVPPQVADCEYAAAVPADRLRQHLGDCAGEKRGRAGSSPGERCRTAWRSLKSASASTTTHPSRRPSIR